MNFLLLFTIGPVQSFIAQARKTQDLFAGSQLLSDLCYEAIKTVGEQNVVFPYLDIQNGKAGNALPNRFVAKIMNSTEEDMQSLADRARLQVETRFRTAAAELLKKETGLSAIPAAFEAQIRTHLDIQWAFLPMKESDTYAKTYAKLERLIGSIKNARPFEQIAYAPEEFGEAGRKCSVDGERNALFFGAETENENYLAQGICLKNTDKVIVEKNEGLSAVSFLKRFYKRETIEQYLAQSVGEISIKHLQWRQDGDQFIEHDAFREYRSKFSGYFDAQYCFEENLTEENFPDRQKLAQIKNWHALLIRHLIKENKNRHYAVVRFDADNMGKWMTGAYLAGQDLEQFQRKLSELLTVFAQKAKSTILTRYKGATVYAGGDDFIGMVSLHYLLEILNDLRVAFKQEVNDRLVQFFPSLRHEITFSAGVAIAYYKTPLSIVLKEARQMEHLAKNRSDSKDAVAISRLKKSGERQQCCFAFGPIVLEKETGHTRNIWLIRRILEQLKTGFSTAFIRNYQLNFARTGEVFRIECDEIDETELLRLITRSREKQTSISDCRELAANLEPFRRNTDFFKFLNIIDFIHRQTS